MRSHCLPRHRVVQWLAWEVMVWKPSPIQYFTVASVSFGGLFLAFALEILVLEGWPWYVHGGLSLGFFALAGILIVVDRRRESRRIAAPALSIIKEAVEGLRTEQSSGEDIRADLRHDLADMRRELREADERERELIEKHKIRIVDDDDYERLLRDMRTGHELSPEELKRHLDLDD